MQQQPTGHLPFHVREYNDVLPFTHAYLALKGRIHRDYMFNSHLTTPTVRVTATAYGRAEKLSLRPLYSYFTSQQRQEDYI